jgi:hypothetical protein
MSSNRTGDKEASLQALAAEASSNKTKVAVVLSRGKACTMMFPSQTAMGVVEDLLDPSATTLRNPPRVPVVLLPRPVLPQMLPQDPRIPATSLEGLGAGEDSTHTVDKRGMLWTVLEQEHENERCLVDEYATKCGVS